MGMCAEDEHARKQRKQPLMPGTRGVALEHGWLARALAWRPLLPGTARAACCVRASLRGPLLLRVWT